MADTGWAEFACPVEGCCTTLAFCRQLTADFNTSDDFPLQVVSLICRQVEAQRGILYLYDDHLDRLAAAASVGHETRSLRHLPLGQEESWLGQVFEAGVPELRQDFQSIDGLMRDIYRQEARDNGVRAAAAPAHVLCMPLAVNEAPFGLLLLEFAGAPQGLGAGELRSLCSMVDFAAMMVHRARILRQQLEKRFSELVSTITHELRTPLTSIKGYATTLLRDDVHWDPAVSRDMVQIIDAESDAMTSLIEDLMKSSMIEAGFLRVRRHPILLPRIIQRAVEDLQAKTQRHRFYVSLPAHFPVLEGDADRLRQALVNLLDNAVKYSPEGGLIVIRSQLNDEEALISVADQGIGIAPEDLNRLFERFYRVRSDLAGTGLGLPVTREIIEKHGGRIWAKSVPGRGSTFYFTLPLSRVFKDAQAPDDT